MRAGESFTMLMPPPDPPVELPVITLPLMVTAPEPFRLIPPPLLGHVLPEITLPMICAVPAPSTEIPPAPLPPKQPACVLFWIVFLRIRADPNSIAIPPPPRHAVLSLIIFSEILGELTLMLTSPPVSWELPCLS